MMILSTGFLITGSNRMEKERAHKLIMTNRRRQQHNNRIIIDTDAWNCCIIAIAAILLSLSLFANAFAESSGGDSGGGDKSKSASDASGHKTGDSNKSKHGGLPVPGILAPRVDKHKQKQSGRDGGSSLPVPGLPAVRTDSDDGGYNDNDNIKKFDTTKSIFRSSDSSHSSKIIEYMPGFNDMFYNSTLPYCFAVTTGACYDYVGIGRLFIDSYLIYSDILPIFLMQLLAIW
jgi:hypothetical protein